MSNSRLDIKRKKLVGKVFETNKCGLCTIVKYEGCFNVTVEFHNPRHLVTCSMGSLLRKQVSNPMFPSFYNSAYMGVGKYSNRDKYLYGIWTGILQRTLSKEYKEKFEAYKYVTICKEWLCFQNFAEWCVNQKGFQSRDELGRVFHIDKDLLSGKSKIYSPETCCFIPMEINNLFVTSGRKSTKWPTGVRFSNEKRKFIAKCKADGKNKHLGSFDTVEEAFQAYTKFKESYVKIIAEKWKGLISEGAYEAIQNWKVLC